MPLARLFRGCAAALMTAFATPAAAGAIDEFPLPTGTKPGGITVGADGALWFIEEGKNSIGRITTGGAVTGHFPVPTDASPSSVSPLDGITLGPDGSLWITQPRDNEIVRMAANGSVSPPFSLPTALHEPEGITVGPDGAIWFTAAAEDKIGRIAASAPHTITTYPPGTATAGNGVGDITAGPDGALWFTEGDGNRIGRITTSGAITNHYVVPTSASEPSGITPGPDGALWFAESLKSKIARITTGGQITEFPGAGAEPSALVVGQDSALWFTEANPAGGAIGRINVAGVITDRFPVPTANGEPSDITAGPDGALWFTEFAGNRIGRIATAAVFTEPSLPPVTPQAPQASQPITKKTCTVPRVRGMTVRRAKSKLRRAKCRYEVRGRGRVAWTKPRAGRRTTKTVRVMAKPRRPRR